MSFKVTVIFGQEQVKKIFTDVPLSEEEMLLNRKEYCFDTESEKNAFCQGIDEGVGWLEYCIPEFVFKKVE